MGPTFNFCLTDLVFRSSLGQVSKSKHLGYVFAYYNSVSISVSFNFNFLTQFYLCDHIVSSNPLLAVPINKHIF